MSKYLSDESAQSDCFFGARPAGRWVLLCLVFLIALSVRLFGIGETPLDFHPVKRYRSAMSARAYYAMGFWIRSPSGSLRSRGPIWNGWGNCIHRTWYRLVAAIYLVTGREHLAGSAIAVVSGLDGGGAFLYLIALRLARKDVAWTAAAFYLLLPFGALASQKVFQIDPLANMLMVLALWAMIRYHESAGVGWLLAAIAVSATTAVVKPTCLP